MTKLFKLKKWLTIKDACKRLSIIFGEEVCSKDLIQLIIEEQINVSYYFKSDEYIQAIEVVKDNVIVLGSGYGEEFLSANKPLISITRMINSIPDGEAFRVYISDEIDSYDRSIYTDYRAIGTKFTLDGAYNIDINTGTIKSILENIFFKHESEFEPLYFNGLIVKDKDGTLYKLITESDDGQPIWSLPPYPLELEPKIKDLVILRTDIEKFEQSFLEVEHTKEQNTPTPQVKFSEKITETDTWKELHNLALKAVSEFPDWKTQNEKPLSNSNTTRKTTMENIDDWLKALQKSTKRENETIKKILIEIFNL